MNRVGIYHENVVSSEREIKSDVLGMVLCESINAGGDRCTGR